MHERVEVFLFFFPFSFLVFLEGERELFGHYFYIFFTYGVSNRITSPSSFGASVV